MKYLVVFSCLLVVAYAIPPEVVKHIKDSLMAACAECKVEVGATDDDVAPLKAHQPATSAKGKCFLACMNKKFKFQDASGKIDKVNAIAQLEKIKPYDEELFGKMKQVADSCFAEVTDDPDECETAHNLVMCMHREHVKAGIKPMDFE